MWLSAHIGSSLYIVLSTQRIDPGSRNSNVSGNHGKIGYQLYGKRSLQMFGNAQSVKFHGGFRRCISFSRFFYQVFVNTGNFFKFVDIQFKDLGFHFFIPFGTVSDEVIVFPSFRDDEVKHHVQHGYVCARFQLKMICGIFCQFYFSRINDNTGHALHEFLFDLCSGYRVSIRRIGSDHDDTIRIFQICNGVGRRSGSKCPLHTERSRRMANPSTAVNIIGSDHCANKLLHEVIFLIWCSCR